MPQHKNRKCISVRGKTYAKLEAIAEASNLSPGRVVEQWVERALADPETSRPQ